MVTNKYISLKQITPLQGVSLTSNIEIIPFNVPHRDEYSETAGFIINGPNKRALFIPDIDKWGKWDKYIRLNSSM